MPKIRRLKEKVLITPEMVPPLAPARLKVIGTFNPAAVEFGGEIRLMVRVVEAARSERPGWKSAPRFIGRPGRPEQVVDWFDRKKEKALDKKTQRFPTWKYRLPFVSHLRLARVSRDGFNLLGIDPEPTFYPEHDFEDLGVEDGRLTRIGDRYYLTYVCLGRLSGAATALAVTRDFRSFRRLGVIFPPYNKDVVLFPEKINGRYYALHRPMPEYGFLPHSIMLASSPDLEHWGHTEFVFGGKASDWCSGKVGSGAPPLKTSEGWLLIFHGVNRKDPAGGPAGTYSAAALLLDRKDPRRVLAWSRSPILAPETAHEKSGYTGQVVFPTGLVRRGGSVILYCGAADTVVSAVELSLDEIFNTLK
jgi:predicted GH43/DUF377 family glycosyl hydrolase